jgi:arginine repressor
VTSAIHRIEARRQEIVIEIERLTGLLPGLDNALEILKVGMEGRISELHTEGKINKEITAQLEQEGMGCSSGTVSTKLRKLGLESHGKRLGGRRKEMVEPDLEEKEPASEPDGEVEESEKEGRRERLLYEVSDERLTELHAQGLNDKAITITLQEEGFSAYQSGVSRRLRKMGLAPQRKTADDRKEEIAALIEEGKSLEEIVAATGLAESSVKMYFSILGMRLTSTQSSEDAPPESESSEDDDWDQGPFYSKPGESESSESSADTRKQREPGEEDDIDAQIRELHALKLTDQQMANKIGRSKGVICQRRNKMGLPSNGKKGPPRGARRSGKATEEGEYPIIGGTDENPVYGSMRMKIIEEKIVDGHKVKVLPPGYAQGAYPQKNVSVQS